MQSLVCLVTLLLLWCQGRQASQSLDAGPLHSWPATFLQGNAAAAGTALINSMGALGGFIGPSLIGFLADDNDEDDYDAAMMAVGVFMMCAGVLMLGRHAVNNCSNAFPAPHELHCEGRHIASQAAHL